MSVRWPYTSELNPNRLAARFLRLNQFENEFSNLTGENYVKYMGTATHTASDSENPKPTGAMIETYQDLKSGGTELRIPVIKPPTAMPVYDDADVTNLGVKAGVVFQRAEVCQTKYTYDLVEGFQKQIIGLATANEINKGAEFLRYLWTQYTDKDLYHTVLNGVSMGLTSMSGRPGARTTLTPHSHGNFYTPGGGKVSYSAGRPGTSGYETSVNAALNNVQVAHTMSTRLIEDLEYEADLMRIPYFETRGGRFRVLLVSSSQAKQLRQDADYRAAVLAGGQGLAFEGPAFKNFQCRWSKTLIFESPKVFGVQGDVAAVTNWGTSYNGMPKYGPSDVYTNVDSLDTNKIKMGIMVGPSMITKAFGINPISFTGHVNEARGQQLLIMTAIQAYVLSDIFDLDGLNGQSAGAFLENTSSLVFATYSPSHA